MPILMLLALHAIGTASQADVYDVSAFGAIGDGLSYDTRAIRAAADSLRLAGGGDDALCVKSGG